MKKVSLLLITVTMIFSILCYGCTSKIDNSKTDSVVSDDNYLSDDEIEKKAVDALYDELELYKDEFDLNSTRYNINKIERNIDSIVVYGTYTTYDNYGKLVDVSEKFHVTIDEKKDLVRCELF